MVRLWIDSDYPDDPDDRVRYGDPRSGLLDLIEKNTNDILELTIEGIPLASGARIDTNTSDIANLSVAAFPLASGSRIDTNTANISSLSLASFPLASGVRIDTNTSNITSTGDTLSAATGIPDELWINPLEPNKLWP